jgi:hypothetical protein
MPRFTLSHIDEHPLRYLNGRVALMAHSARRPHVVAAASIGGQAAGFLMVAHRYRTPLRQPQLYPAVPCRGRRGWQWFLSPDQPLPIHAAFWCGNRPDMERNGSELQCAAPALLTGTCESPWSSRNRRTLSSAAASALGPTITSTMLFFSSGCGSSRRGRLFEL